MRTAAEWHGFFRASAVHAESGITAFWVALSFWLQRQIDMTETVQSWLYRQFQSKVKDSELRRALIDIAALSTERRPLPETMLPKTTDWPVSQKLEDLRSEIGAFGLVRPTLEGIRYWALAHDVLGRFLLNALYHDPSTREEAGFPEASSPEHFRFLALRRLSANPSLSLPVNRTIAEDFAVNIFKIDPAHGHATFAMFWSEALAALDEMPQILWRTSRTLRHHAAISRRRIANDEALFQLGPAERLEVLKRAIEDIRYAIDNIRPAYGEEFDLNLYNSLARAYQDLHKALSESGASRETLEDVRALAQDATRRAFQLNPDSPFVIETYARSLLDEAEINADCIGSNAIEVLNLVFSEMDRDRSGQRRFELSRLAEHAVELLMKDATAPVTTRDEALTAIIEALRALTAGLTSVRGLALSDFPEENRRAAIEKLSSPEAQSNLQVVRMLYLLKCLDEPYEFTEQLSLLEVLNASNYPISPQNRLEFAVLLHHCGRYEDAETLFRRLRPLWKTGEYFGQVPERLRWLLAPDKKSRLQVNARVAPGREGRGYARVFEMRGISVPFRPVDFGRREIKPGTDIRGYISFGYNGPFLSAMTATR